MMEMSTYYFASSPPLNGICRDFNLAKSRSVDGKLFSRTFAIDIAVAKPEVGNRYCVFTHRAGS
jgi:hypothetical protein